MSAKKWARVKRTGTHGLRRGAWYPVVSDPNSGLLILSVRQNNVPVLRAHVEVSDSAPQSWSVVRWEETQRGVRRASEQNLGLTYAVCPGCAERARLDMDAPSLTCAVCGGAFPVDWEHPC
ncbi:MAG TPA: hypothetical protein VD793_05615 [Gemmatimonadales bacterium]|nr:hypothetical protein [Gemmatimonadales bacterium]